MRKFCEWCTLQNNLAIAVVGTPTWLGRARSANSAWDLDRVELSFATSRLRSICRNRRTAKTALGEDAARELASRLADFVAATTVAELSDLFGDDIIDRPPSERSLRLHTGYNLVFRAGHVTPPIDADGTTDWAQVTRVQVVALEVRNA
ncbi:MAG TPA: hypothetical protein VNZ53_12290 [Steroidobacteraceae bacterium]|nr:hypothetical protein [Steroidobacteraceae bacterium]